jgi:hypothetical protein
MASADRDEIILDGDRYLSAAQAAADYGLTRDAIARLARHGKVRGRRFGRNWYVETRSLRAHLKVLGAPAGVSEPEPEPLSSAARVARAMHARGVRPPCCVRGPERPRRRAKSKPMELPS